MSLSRNVAGNFESRASHQFYDVISQRDDHVTNCSKAKINVAAQHFTLPPKKTTQSIRVDKRRIGLFLEYLFIYSLKPFVN